MSKPTPVALSSTVLKLGEDGSVIRKAVEELSEHSSQHHLYVVSCCIAVSALRCLEPSSIMGCLCRRTGSRARQDGVEHPQLSTRTRVDSRPARTLCLHCIDAGSHGCEQRWLLRWGRSFLPWVWGGEGQCEVVMRDDGCAELTASSKSSVKAQCGAMGDPAHCVFLVTVRWKSWLSLATCC